MTVLFVSDVHLGEQRPEVVGAFLALLEGARGRVERLYVLGDLFDAWLGDDDERDLPRRAAAAIAGLADSGTAVHLMQGNHDFLLGQDFAGRCGATLLDDPCTVDVHGRAVVLSHGDALCTDDTDYQVFRRWSRDPANQQAFLALPLAARARQAAELQERSRASTRRKAAEIMDVNGQAVADLLRRTGADVLVHGHTHRPDRHELRVDGRPRVRHVLGDWYAVDRARVLHWTAADGPRLTSPADLFD